MSAFALFPLVAIFYQFGWKQSVVAALLVLLSRLIVVRYFPHLFPESIEIFVGMVLLLGIAIFRDLKDRRASQRVKRLRPRRCLRSAHSVSSTTCRLSP